MSTSLTVIGGHSGATLTGLVTVPSFFSTASGVNTTLQGLLTAESGLVTAGGVNFQNLDIAGDNGTVFGSNTAGTGLIELTNTDAFGATTAGAANVTFNLPSGYNFLVVQAPGTETINSGVVSDFTALFGGASSVSFIGEGSGSVYAAGAGDNIIDYGTAWSVFGSDAGGTSVASGAASAYISVGGSASAPGNVVGIGGANVSSTVVSSGTGDLIEDYSGSAVVSVNASANVLVNGGFDTVYADAGSTSVNAFFNSFGGDLYFINNSTVAAQVSAGDPGSAGHTTVEGGVGGGSYEGGDGGNNSLIGNTGLVTLYGGNGNNNFLSASGFGTGAAANALFAGTGNSTLVATSTTGSNQFGGGSGTDSMVSFGQGTQSFFVGTGGSETITGTQSTVAGATNNYYFLQDSSQGGGTDVITNYRPGVDHGYINPFGSDSGVSISGISSIIGGTGGTLLQLSDGTDIKLLGVNPNSVTIGGGGTTF
jgi:hypothetical protein